MELTRMCWSGDALCGEQGPGRLRWPPRAPGNAELCDETFAAYFLKISI